MSKPAFVSPDEWALFVSQSPLENFKTSFAGFSYEEIAESFVILQTQPSTDAKNKLVSLFQFIDASKGLETLGKHLSLPRFLNLLNFLSLNPSFHDRLPFILTGLETQIFSKALNFFQPHHLALFKDEGLLEPLQYHLTQFIHEGEGLLQHIHLEANRFENDINSTASVELSPDQLNGFIHQIDNYRNQILDFLDRASTALSIAWNTDRIDLIEKLSTINELMQHHIVAVIGHQSSDHFPSTGLYATLEKTFSKIFDSSLKNEDASVEGLTRLSIWHLNDYWQLGLLPHILQPEELDLDPEQFDDIKRSAHHQDLFAQVQKQLEKLKIGTVEDLKREYLFSKPLLKAYIARHGKLLN